MSAADCLCQMDDITTVTIPDCLADGVCRHPVTVSTFRRIGASAPPEEISEAVRGIFDEAEEIIGTKPARWLLVIDQTGYRTVVRAMVGGDR